MLNNESSAKVQKLMNSGYIDHNNDEEFVLLDGAPPDIVELYEWYMGIIKKQKLTGETII